MKFLKGISLLVVVCFVCAGTILAQELAKKSLEVSEAKLGRDVKDRVIVQEDSTFKVNDRVYLWMKIVGGSSDSVTVTWKTGDQKYVTTLRVGGSPWRTWAYKTAAKAGEWSVAVTDDKGNLLKELTFRVE